MPGMNGNVVNTDRWQQNLLVAELGVIFVTLFPIYGFYIFFSDPKIIQFVFNETNTAQVVFAVYIVLEGIGHGFYMQRALTTQENTIARNTEMAVRSLSGLTILGYVLTREDVFQNLGSWIPALIVAPLMVRGSIEFVKMAAAIREGYASDDSVTQQLAKAKAWFEARQGVYFCLPASCIALSAFVAPILSSNISYSFNLAVLIFGCTVVAASQLELGHSIVKLVQSLRTEHAMVVPSDSEAQTGATWSGMAAEQGPIDGDIAQIPSSTMLLTDLSAQLKPNNIPLAMNESVSLNEFAPSM